MIGDMLYHVHRHFRLLVLAIALFALGGVGVLAYVLARHLPLS